MADSVRLRTLDDLPGPRGLPWIGNLLQVVPTRMHQVVERWSREHGPFFRFTIGTTRVLVVADHAALAAVMRDRPDGFRRADRMVAVGREMGLEIGVFAAEGEAWRRQRRMVMAAFDPEHVHAYLRSLLAVVGRLRGRWQRAARSGQPIDLLGDLKRFTVDAVAGLAFGASVDSLSADHETLLCHLERIFPALSNRMLWPVPYWRYLQLPSNRRLEESVRAVNVAIGALIARARERMSADAALRDRPGNLLEAMIAAADRDGSGDGDRDVAGNVLTMLLAGEDTTANTLAWLIYLLSRHPDALLQARDEVSRVVTDGVMKATSEQLAALTFLEACAQETMRLKPAAPVLGLQAVRDATIGDVHVPVGTLIWGVMRHDTVSDRFFPNAGAFEPERWLAGGATAPQASAMRRVSAPFGGGPRICPGRFLALLEIKAVMAMLLLDFEIDRVGTAGGGTPKERLAFTMAPVGLRMRLRDRG